MHSSITTRAKTRPFRLWASTVVRLASEHTSTLMRGVGLDEHPRFSERKEDHWFHSDKDGLSYAGASLTSC